jgi:hypothetical protein
VEYGHLEVRLFCQQLVEELEGLGVMLRAVHGYQDTGQGELPFCGATAGSIVPSVRGFGKSRFAFQGDQMRGTGVSEQGF